MTTYFSVLDLGFGGSIVKFVAHYRAKRDARGLNEIASTLFVHLQRRGAASRTRSSCVLAFNIHHVFNITPEQHTTGRSLMLIIGVYVSLGFPFSIFGGVINGFQRYDLNNIVGVGSSVIVAVVNVVMLLAGCIARPAGAGDDRDPHRHLLRVSAERLSRLPGAADPAVASFNGRAFAS